MIDDARADGKDASWFFLGKEAETEHVFLFGFGLQKCVEGQNLLSGMAAGFSGICPVHRKLVAPLLHSAAKSFPKSNFLKCWGDFE